jgi:hypothetical protein
MFTLHSPRFAPVRVASLKAAQDAYAHRRDQSAEGASTWPFATVTDETTGTTYTVSYNGRVWQGEQLVREF